MESESFEVRVASTSSTRITCGPFFLSDILHGAQPGEQLIVECQSKTYLFLFSEAQHATANWSSEDATLFCTKLINSSQHSAVCFFNISPEERSWDLEQAKTGENEVICLSILTNCDASANSLQSTLGQPWRSYHPPPSRAAHLLSPFTFQFRKLGSNIEKPRFIKFSLLLGLACIVGILLLFVSLKSNSDGVWQRYNIDGSAGPRYQLQFTHHNVSSWSEKYQSPDETWFVRIDDQAMIPLNLIDEGELRYQRWFQSRYPEANNVRLQGLFLQESFLGDYLAIQVPADKQFHMAHCVLALRRYYWAKESGKHICPRDIDSKHIQHCLDALDSWAFPEGPRTSVDSGRAGVSSHHHDAQSINNSRRRENLFLDETDKTRLIWKTKVCFNDAAAIP